MVRIQLEWWQHFVFRKVFRKHPKTGVAAMATATAAWKSTIHI
jgi:hypothetical protein